MKSKLTLEKKIFRFYLSLFVPFISSLRRIASHVSLVTTVMLWGSQRPQENAGKVSSVWRVQIVLTLL